MANDFNSTENFQSDEAKYRTSNYYDYDAVPRAKFFEDTLFVDTNSGIQSDVARHIAVLKARRRAVFRTVSGVFAVAFIVVFGVLLYLGVNGKIF